MKKKARRWRRFREVQWREYRFVSGKWWMLSRRDGGGWKWAIFRDKYIVADGFAPSLSTAKRFCALAFRMRELLWKQKKRLWYAEELWGAEEL